MIRSQRVAQNEIFALAALAKRGYWVLAVVVCLYVCVRVCVCLSVCHISRLLDWFSCLFRRSEQGSRRHQSEQTLLRRRCRIARLTMIA